MIQELLLTLPLFNVQASTQIYTAPSFVSLLPSSGTPNIGTINIAGVVTVSLSSGTSPSTPLWVTANSTGLPVIPHGITPVSISSLSSTNPGYVLAAQNGSYTITAGTGVFSVAGSTAYVVMSIYDAAISTTVVGWQVAGASIPVHEVGVNSVALSSGSASTPFFVNLISSPSVSIGQINTTISSYNQASTGTTTVELKDSGRTTITFSTASMLTTRNKVSLSTWTVYTNGVNTNGTASYVVSKKKKLRLENFEATYAPAFPPGGIPISSSTLIFQVGAGISTSPYFQTYTLYWASGTPIMPYAINWQEGLELSSTTVFSIAHRDWANNFMINFSVEGYEY